MNILEVLLFLGVMVYMIASQVGTHLLTARRLLRPLLIALGLGAFSVSSLSLAGGDGALIGAGILLGAGFGTLAATFMRVERRGGQVFVTAGLAYALVWVVSLGGRLLFGWLATHGLAQDVMRFSMEHHVTGAAAWRNAFMLMTVAELGVRTLLVLARARRGQRARTGALA